MAEQDKLPIIIEPLDVIQFEEPITLIKVDVEGFEMNVFKGAHDTLKKHKQATIFTVHAFMNRSVRFQQ